MCEENGTSIKESKLLLDYLKELLMDRSILSNSPSPYIQVGKILDREILKVRIALLSGCGICAISETDLPDPEGPKVNLQSKIYMPVESNNSFNFVGRLLGPEGSTAKCLQQCLGVKIMIRGRGSMRDRKKEEANLGRPNWEHLNDNLHVLITTEDYENRAKARLAKASEYINLFLRESLNGSEREDKVKQMQLVELSVRKELRARPWHLLNCLPDISIPAKPSHVLPNVDSVNMGYGCSSTPFYPTLQHGQHFAPFSPPYQHQAMNHASAQGHLGGMPHQPFSNPSHGMNTTLLLGNGMGTYHGPYSSDSQQSHPSQTLQTALAVPAVNYWSHAPSSLSHMSSNYSVPTTYPHNHLTNGTQQSHDYSSSDGVTSNQFENTMNGNVGGEFPRLSQSNLNSEFIPSQQQTQQKFTRLHEVGMESNVIKEFNKCTVSNNASPTENENLAQKGQMGVVHSSRNLYNPAAISNRQTPDKSPPTTCEDAIGNRHSNNNSKRRYSQKHSQFSAQSNGHLNRNNPVVVKVNLPEHNACSHEDLVSQESDITATNKSDFDTSGVSTESSVNSAGKFDHTPVRISVISAGSSSQPRSGVPVKLNNLDADDPEWPKLGSVSNEERGCTSKPQSPNSHTSNAMDTDRHSLNPKNPTNSSADDTGGTISSNLTDTHKNSKLTTCLNGKTRSH